MEGIDISKTKIPDFGPLSLSWFKPMYIDDEKWSNKLSEIDLKHHFQALGDAPAARR